MTNAVIYVRVSTGAQTDGTSLQSQEEACRKFAAEQGFTNVEVISDVYSGAYLHDRPGLSRLRDGVKLGLYSDVIAFAVDRFSRSLAHLAIMVEELERYNVTLHFTTEILDTSPEGKLLQSVRGFVAEIEREKIRERCMRGRRTHAINGTLSFGRALFGYRISDNGHRVISDGDASCVTAMFDDVLSGRSLRSIAEKLNRAGVSTPTGSIWWPQSVKSIINNPAYCGRTVAFRYKHDVRYESGVRIHNGSAKGDPTLQVELPNVTPAIISVETWELAQAIISERNLRKPGRTPKREFLLRGLVVCATCGRKFSPTVKKGRYRYYVCTSTQNPSLTCGTKSFTADRAEEYVWTWVTDLLNTSVNEKRKTSKPATQHPAAAIDEQLQRKRTEVERLIKRAATADDSLWNDFEKEILKRKQEIQKLELQKQKTLKTQLQPSQKAASLQEIKKRARGRLHTLTFTERVTILKDLNLRCTWNGVKLKLETTTT